MPTRSKQVGRFPPFSNSEFDLPGDIKALITSNVFDTASGRYLLIPQGARLVGKYDSRISYGQDGVQVAWDRVIFLDASSVDINGMVGLDSHGNSGLRAMVLITTTNGSSDSPH